MIILRVFLQRDVVLAQYMLTSCAVLRQSDYIRLSVTSRCSTKPAKHRTTFTQKTPHDSPGLQFSDAENFFCEIDWVWSEKPETHATPMTIDVAVVPTVPTGCSVLPVQLQRSNVAALAIGKLWWLREHQ